MSRKILAALAPAALLVAFMAIPSLAQATQIQCGSSECANGSTIKFQSSNLSTQAQNPHSITTCTGTEWQGTLGNNQGETIEGSLTKSVSTGCTAGGHTSHQEQSMSQFKPLTVQFQQPDPAGPEVIHIHPPSGLVITHVVIIQEFGFTVATCTYSANSIQLAGTAQSDELSVTGSNQFTLAARSGIAAGECGTVGTTTEDLKGALQVETSSGGAVAVHMS